MDISFYSPINDFYSKFFKKFEEIETLPKSKWDPVHVLSYFCKKYYQQYKTHYKFKFNTPQPSKCFEIFQIKRLGENLSKDPNILIEYIDWIFSVKIKLAKRKITSVSFLNNEIFLKDYKLMFLANDFVSRTKELPEFYISLFADTDYPVKTYGELAFVFKSGVDLKDIYEKMKLNGFDFDILNKVN